MLTKLSTAIWATALLYPNTAQCQGRLPNDLALSKRTIRFGSQAAKMTLSSALHDAVLRMQGDYLTFGVEFSRNEVVEPTVDVGAPAGVSIEAFLDGIFRQVPQYEYEAVSPHLISIDPRGAKADASDPLNVTLSHFDVEQTNGGTILGYPVESMPELRERLYPGKRTFLYIGPVTPGPLVTLHLANVTVRDALNAVSLATESAPNIDDYPVGWTFRYVAESGGDVPRFGTILTLPEDWKETLHPNAGKAGKPGR